MPRGAVSNDTAYPQLSRLQIDTLIGALLEQPPGDILTVDTANRENTLAYLLNFYTKRWGLPERVRRNLDRT